MGTAMPSATGVRLTLKFNFPQEIRFCGWSESYDTGYASLAAAIGGAKALGAFLVDRVNCLGIGPILVEAVLSAYVQPLTPGAAPVRRATFPLPVPPAPQPGDTYNPAFSTDPSNDADYGPTVLLMSAVSDPLTSPTYRRSIWIAGLPDSADLTAQLRLTGAIAPAAVDKLIGDLNNTNTTLGGQNNFCIRSVDRSGANPIKPCAAWLFGPPISFIVPAHGFVVGQPIQAEGCTTAPGGSAPRGRYLVATVIDANTITLQGLQKITASINTGGFRASVITFNPIKQVIIEGMTKRNKGRPSGLSVGRRPKKRTQRA